MPVSYFYYIFLSGLSRNLNTIVARNFFAPLWLYAGPLNFHHILSWTLPKAEHNYGQKHVCTLRALCRTLEFYVFYPGLYQNLNTVMAGKFFVP